MAKKKWYVVTAGRDVGVYESWSDVGPLVSGVSGALHESFSTEEEANEAFDKAKVKGSVKVIGGTRSRDSTSVSCSPSTPSPTPPSQRASLQSTQRSALANSQHDYAIGNSRQSSRPPSPPLIYPNVSYTRGSVSPARGPSHSQQVNAQASHGPPRAVVHTPVDIKPYPTEYEDDSTVSSSLSSHFLLSPRPQISESLRALSSPSLRATVHTPSDIPSYQDNLSFALISSMAGSSSASATPRATVHSPSDIASYQNLSSTVGSHGKERFQSSSSPAFTSLRVPVQIHSPSPSLRSASFISSSPTGNDQSPTSPDGQDFFTPGNSPLQGPGRQGFSPSINPASVPRSLHRAASAWPAPFTIYDRQTASLDDCGQLRVPCQHCNGLNTFSLTPTQSKFAVVDPAEVDLDDPRSPFSRQTSNLVRRFSPRRPSPIPHEYLGSLLLS